MPRSAKGIAKRAADPLLAALDRRLDQLAARLERHTSGLAADHARHLERVDDRLQIGLRVVDENLLASARPPATTAAAITAEFESATVLVAPPGVALLPVPIGFRLGDVTSFLPADDGAWRVIDGDAGGESLRVARLAPTS